MCCATHNRVLYHQQISPLTFIPTLHLQMTDVHDNLSTFTCLHLFQLRYSIRLNCRRGVYDYMPHPQRCEYYHYCLNGFLMIMRCPYDFTWHYERRTCVHKSQSKCYVDSSILAQQPVVIYRYNNSG